MDPAVDRHKVGLMRVGSCRKVVPAAEFRKAAQLQVECRAQEPTRAHQFTQALRRILASVGEWVHPTILAQAQTLVLVQVEPV